MKSGTKKRMHLGQTGETLACQHLKQKGYLIREKNYTTPLGEIDIVAEEDGDLVFVEVKTRSSIRFGTPAESVTPRKQQQIIKVANYYAAQKNCFDRSCRFDVVSIILPEHGCAEVEVIKNAFGQS